MVLVFYFETNAVNIKQYKHKELCCHKIDYLMYYIKVVASKVYLIQMFTCVLFSNTHDYFLLWKDSMFWHLELESFPRINDSWKRMLTS